jgi:hypothetical protein
MEAPFDRTGIYSDPVRRTKFVGARPVWTHLQLRTHGGTTVRSGRGSINPSVDERMDTPVVYLEE